MPLSDLLKFDASTCRYCNQKARVLTWDHPDCHRTHQARWNEMVELAAQAARAHSFDEKALRVSLSELN